jgi:hypothetical protein
MAPANDDRRSTVGVLLGCKLLWGNRAELRFVRRDCLCHRQEVPLFGGTLCEREIHPSAERRRAPRRNRLVRRTNESAIHRDGQAFLAGLHIKMITRVRLWYNPLAQLVEQQG